MLQRFLLVNTQSIFLIDGLGALLSTVLLLVIAYFETIFGMPRKVLFQLLPVTAVFGVYSLGIYLLQPQRWKRFLALIAFANILYCCLTAGFLFAYFNELTRLGMAYFFGEIFLVLFLSVVELRLVWHPSKTESKIDNGKDAP